MQFVISCVRFPKQARPSQNPSRHRPEEILTDKQKRWLEPSGLVMRLVARILFFANRTVMRRLFRVEAEGPRSSP